MKKVQKWIGARNASRKRRKEDEQALNDAIACNMKEIADNNLKLSEGLSELRLPAETPENTIILSNVAEDMCSSTGSPPQCEPCCESWDDVNCCSNKINDEEGLEESTTNMPSSTRSHLCSSDF